jgi:hypothetical protein
MYSKFYISFVLVIVLFTVLKLTLKGTGVKVNDLPIVPSYKVLFISVIVVLVIAFFPANYGSDKERYLDMFVNFETKKLSYDFGWTSYIRIFNFFSSSSTLFFSVTALLYFLGNYIFLKSIIQKKYLFYFIITTVGALGFFAYGVNTIRAGLGLSLLLLAIVNRKNWKFILFMALAIIIHKSMVIPAVAYFITKYFSKTKHIFKVWMFFFMLSVLNITVISDFIANQFSGLDDRVGGYVGVESSEIYSSGFRVDFLIYSIIPIAIGYYYLYKLKYSNIFYNRMLNMYIIVNSFWLLLIRIPFTDRFAYLSWFLIPIIVMYPLFHIDRIKNRNVKVGMAMSIIVFLNFILNFK